MAHSLTSAPAQGRDFPHGIEDQSAWPMGLRQGQRPLAKVLERVGSPSSLGHSKARIKVLERVECTYLTAAGLSRGAQAASLITARDFLG